VDAIPHLSFAAQDGRALLGTLQSWPVLVAGERATLVGPVAVSPAHQRSGVGRLLMTRLIEAAGEMPMMMIGDPEYYGRFFGFAADVTGGWMLPGPVERHRLLARNMQAGLVGVVGPDVSALAA
jgi:predicted N-acetyltransferase YhbS